MFTVTFWKDLLERSAKAFLAVFIPAILAGVADVHDISTARALVLSAISAGVMAVLSVLSLPFTGTVSPASVVKPPAE